MLFIDCCFMDLNLLHHLPSSYFYDQYFFCLVHLNHYTVVIDLLRRFSLITFNKNWCLHVFIDLEFFFLRIYSPFRDPSIKSILITNCIDSFRVFFLEITNKFWPSALHQTRNSEAYIIAFLSDWCTGFDLVNVSRKWKRNLDNFVFGNKPESMREQEQAFIINQCTVWEELHAIHWYCLWLIKKNSFWFLQERRLFFSWSQWRTYFHHFAFLSSVFFKHYSHWELYSFPNILCHRQ